MNITDKDTNIMDWLEGLSQSTTCTRDDAIYMKYLLHSLGYTDAITTCHGQVYIEGWGMPVSIHVLARQMVGSQRVLSGVN